MTEVQHQDLVDAATSLDQSFTLQVHNTDGWYSARYDIYYVIAGHEFQIDVRDITIGITKSSFVPGSATDVRLKVSEWWGFGWRTIFTETWPQLDASHCYEIWGTTLNTKWKEVGC